MKKIGLITIYSVPNYGSVLQAYATQEKKWVLIAISLTIHTLTNGTTV